MNHNRGLILFTKYPEKGSVKTRIAKHLGDDFAFELYSRLVRDSIELLREIEIPVLVALSPERKIDDFKEWCGVERRFIYYGQRGRGLGEKMSNAFIDAFASGFAGCILIGCDLPALPASILTQALALLKKNDAVIGPASDGGYYLIGFKKRRFLPVAFQGIRWSARSVFQKTITIFRQFGIETGVLDEWGDIDTIEDLAGILRRENINPAQSHSALTFIVNHRHAIIEAAQTKE